MILATCGLFLLLAAPFLMAATIIIYAGAIIVTFLFVLMLSQQQGPSDSPLAHADGAEQTQRLRAVLAELPDRQRQAIVEQIGARFRQPVAEHNQCIARRKARDAFLISLGSVDPQRQASRSVDLVRQRRVEAQ